MGDSSPKAQDTRRQKSRFFANALRTTRSAWVADQSTTLPGEVWMDRLPVRPKREWQTLRRQVASSLASRRP
jgi:hypothetical protein